MNTRRVIMGVVIAAAVLRMGIVVVFGSPPRDAWLPDEQQYWSMAEDLRAGHGLQDELGFRATRMPLYPWLLSWFAGAPSGRVWALLVQAVLAAGAAGWAAALAARVARATPISGIHLPPAAVALGAGTLVACDPFLAYFTRFTLTENLFTPALLAAWTCGWPPGPAATTRPLRWVLCGLLWAVCIYLRPSASGLALLWGLWRLGLGGGWRTIGGLAVSGALVLLALLPWAVRNERLDRATWLTHRMGISLYDGLGPQATGASDLGTIKQTAAVRGMNEVQWNAHFRRAAWASVRDDPGRALQLALIKFGRTWRPWPAAPGHDAWMFKLIGGGWSLSLLLTAVAGAAVLRPAWSTTCGLLLPVVYFTGLHMVFVGSVRYRLPVMPLIAVLATVGLIGLWLNTTAGRPAGTMKT